MGDDFFEDQPQETPSESKAPKKDAPKKGSGDVKKAVAGKGAKPAAKAASKAPAPKAVEGLAVPQQVDLLWTVALVVVAFVVGFFFRGLFLPPATTTSQINTGISAPAPSTQGQSAPALSEEQVQGGLPQGHPSIGGESTQSGGTAVTPPAGSGMGNIKSDVPASGPLGQGDQSVEVESGKTDKE